MIPRIPENEYVEFQGHKIITMESVRKYHSSDQIKAFKEWFSSVPIKGVSVCDYEQWCKEFTVYTNKQYEECSERLEKTLNALHEIAELGANPLTKYGCKTREDLMRHMDKMWIAALNAIKEDLETYLNFTKE